MQDLELQKKSEALVAGDAAESKKGQAAWFSVELLFSNTKRVSIGKSDNKNLDYLGIGSLPMGFEPRVIGVDIVFANIDCSLRY